MTLLTSARRADAPALATLMFHAVRSGAYRYTSAQRRAWMPKRPAPARFADRLSGMRVVVARSMLGPVGFVAMHPNGYIDLVFVLPHAQGKGLFRKLVTAAMKGYGPSFSTHASLQAQPAFLALGFEICHHERVRRNGQLLRRAFMRLDQTKP